MRYSAMERAGGAGSVYAGYFVAIRGTQADMTLSLDRIKRG